MLEKESFLDSNLLVLKLNVSKIKWLCYKTELKLDYDQTSQVSGMNYIWIIFFGFAFLIGLFKLLILQDYDIFPDLMQAIFDYSEKGFQLALGLTSVLCFWMGILKVAEKGGVIELFSKFIRPLFKRLFPEVPEKHPANTAIIMNIAANMLGLDNAATPMGIKAMKDLQTLNPNKNEASNSQILFLVLNTSGLTLIPISIIAYRFQYHAANSSDIFIPILLTTFCSTVGGLFIVSIYQRINLFDRVILTYLIISSLAVASLVYFFYQLNYEDSQQMIQILASLLVMTLICGFIFWAWFKKVNVFEGFIEGAKGGFEVAISIMPYLIAILVGIQVFRVAGGMELIQRVLEIIFNWIGLGGDYLKALPVALMKPLSGSGARGFMIDAMEQYGVDSFIGRLACTMQGSTDTTFYVLAVYFGAIKMRKTRHALICGLFADFIGIFAAILISYIFFT